MIIHYLPLFLFSLTYTSFIFVSLLSNSKVVWYTHIILLIDRFNSVLNLKFNNRKPFHFPKACLLIVHRNSEANLLQILFMHTFILVPIFFNNKYVALGKKSFLLNVFIKRVTEYILRNNNMFEFNRLHLTHSLWMNCKTEILIIGHYWLVNCNVLIIK